MKNKNSASCFSLYFYGRMLEILFEMLQLQKPYFRQM